jgi:hypothetical protein
VPPGLSGTRVGTEVGVGFEVPPPIVVEGGPGIGLGDVMLMELD